MNKHTIIVVRHHACLHVYVACDYHVQSRDVVNLGYMLCGTCDCHGKEGQCHIHCAVSILHALVQWNLYLTDTLGPA